MIDWHGFAHPKPRPRVVDRIAQKRDLAAKERACRKAVDARDHRRCFYPGCKAYASDKHHIVARSQMGRWVTSNIISGCHLHHSYFKAGLIAVQGNPDHGPVKVRLTALGQREGLKLPMQKVA